MGKINIKIMVEKILKDEKFATETLSNEYLNSAEGEEFRAALLQPENFQYLLDLAQQTKGKTARQFKDSLRDILTDSILSAENWYKLLLALSFTTNVSILSVLENSKSFAEFKQYLLDHKGALTALLDKDNLPELFIARLFNDAEFAIKYLVKNSYDPTNFYQLHPKIINALANFPDCIAISTDMDQMAAETQEKMAIKNLLGIIHAKLSTTPTKSSVDSYYKVFSKYIPDSNPVKVCIELLNVDINIRQWLPQIDTLFKDVTKNPDKFKSDSFTPKTIEGLDKYIFALYKLKENLEKLKDTEYYDEIQKIAAKQFSCSPANLLTVIKNQIIIANDTKIALIELSSKQENIAPFDPMKAHDSREIFRQLEKRSQDSDAAKASHPHFSKTAYSAKKEKEKKEALDNSRKRAIDLVTKSDIPDARKKEIIDRINHPYLMDQEDNALCGPTAFLMHLAEVDPIKYADTAIKLLVDRKVTIDNPQTGDKLHLVNKYDDKKMAQRSIDLIFLSALRREANALNIYASAKSAGKLEVLMGYTKPDDFERWYKAFFGECPVKNTTQIYGKDYQPANSFVESVSGVKSNPEYADLDKNLLIAIDEINKGNSVTMFITMGLAMQIVNINKDPYNPCPYQSQYDECIDIGVGSIEFAHYVKANNIKLETDKEGKKFVIIDIDTWGKNHQAKIPYDDFIKGYRGIISAETGIKPIKQLGPTQPAKPEASHPLLQRGRGMATRDLLFKAAQPEKKEKMDPSLFPHKPNK